MAKKKAVKNNKKKKSQKTAPYNVCDRFCERCNYRSKCSVFKNSREMQIQSALDGNDPQDIKNIFVNLETGFKQIKAIMKEMAKEDGVNIGDVLTNKALNKQYKIIEVNVKKHSLYKKSQEFHWYADKFLKRFFIFSQTSNPFLLPALNKEINDLSFYFPMISGKIHQALSLLFDSPKTKREFLNKDMNCSACLALNASLVCEKAVGGIIRETSDLYIESMQFLTMINDLRNCILETFPEAESFRDDIIFNTSL